MLPQQHRLRLQKDIQTLFARGKSVFGLTLMVRWRPNRLPVSRFAVVIGTKVAKKAVVRNRVKRRLRAIIEKYLTQFSDGYDLVIVPKKDAIGKKSQELEQELLALLKKKTPLFPKS